MTSKITKRYSCTVPRAPKATMAAERSWWCTKDMTRSLGGRRSPPGRVSHTTHWVAKRKTASGPNSSGRIRKCQWAELEWPHPPAGPGWSLAGPPVWLGLGTRQRSRQVRSSRRPDRLLPWLTTLFCHSFYASSSDRLLTTDQGRSGRQDQIRRERWRNLKSWLMTWRWMIVGSWW